jgi:hypothetical protein
VLGIDPASAINRGTNLMSNVYQIGVKIAMSGNSTQFLAALGQQLTGVHLKANQLAGSLNRVKLAFGGMASLAAGAGLFHVLAKTADAAKDLSHELVQIQKLGVTSDQFKNIQAAAQSVAHAVRGTTELDALKAYGSIHSMVGYEDSLKMMQPLANFAQAMGNTTGNYAQAFDKGAFEMVRAAELLGKLVNNDTHKVDIEKLKGFLDIGARVVIGTHGKVTPETWLQMAQQGGPAMSGMTDQGLLSMGIMAQAMGGFRAGTALMSQFQAFKGGVMTQRSAEALKDLGLVGDFDVKRGGHVVFKKGSLDTPFTREMGKDPLSGMQQVIQAMNGKGITNIDQQVEKLFQIFGRATVQRFAHDMLRNMPQMLQERENWGKTLGVGPSNDLANKEDYSKILYNLSAAFKDFQMAIGHSEAMIAIMKSLTSALDTMTKWAQDNPGTVKLISEALIAIAAGLTALGVVIGSVAVVAALAALGTTGAIIVGLGALGAAVGVLLKMDFAGFGTKITAFFDSLAAALSGGIAKLFSTLQHVAPGDADDRAKGLGDVGRRFRGGAPLPPAPGKQGSLIQNNLHIDGKQFASIMTEHVTSSAEHSRQAPAFNSYAMYNGPSGQAWEA